MGGGACTDISAVVLLFVTDTLGLFRRLLPADRGWLPSRNGWQLLFGWKHGKPLCDEIFTLRRDSVSLVMSPFGLMTLYLCPATQSQLGEAPNE